MDIRKISTLLSVSPQIYPAHIAGIAARGFKTIINNRPDREVDDQPMADELAAEAARQGLIFINLPVISGRITEQNIVDFAAELDRAQAPVLVFCRSGMRSTILWGLTKAGHMDAGAIINLAASIGYDLKGQQENFERIAEQVNGAAKAKRK